ncbi:hypothetical protein IPN35_02300 [Candidatus Peregrinibacteria bacterium]|nr:MAG: hypothetical protein IPN35_02300 [Candidatus Peregrinibacteria bacterium]
MGKQVFFFFLALTSGVLLLLVVPTSLGDYQKTHANAPLFSRSFTIPTPISISTPLPDFSLQAPSQVEEAGDSELCSVKPFNNLPKEQEQVFRSAAEFIPCSFLLGLESITTFDDMSRPRALSGATSLYIRSDLFSLPERKQVLIHELGHIVDLSGLKGVSGSEASLFRDGTHPVLLSDPSIRFYEISWKNEKKQKEGGGAEDFVTGYAATDPFEDFAESFLFYLEQGNAFREYAKKNAAIQKKYDFLKRTVFDDVEFLTGGIPTDLSSREWDATRVKFPMNHS